MSTLKIKNNPCNMTKIISFTIIVCLDISHEFTEGRKEKKPPTRDITILREHKSMMCSKTVCDH
jgi:hypothetical protein